MVNRNKNNAKKYEQEKESEFKRKMNLILDSEYSNLYGVCSYFATFIFMIIDAFSTNIQVGVANFLKMIVVLIALIISWIWKTMVKKRIVNIKDKTINFGYLGFVLCAFSVCINIYVEFCVRIGIIFIGILMTIGGIYYPIKIAKK